MCAQLARFTTDLQQRRREVARLNSTCASHRHRIAALVSSNSTSSQLSADTVIATDIDSTETSTAHVLPLSAQFSGAAASTTSTSIASRPLDKSSAAAAITETVVASSNDSSLSSSLSRQILELFLNNSIQDLTNFPRSFFDTESFCGINTRDWTRDLEGRILKYQYEQLRKSFLETRRWIVPICFL